ncbi:autotransporter outer membrane beta-barrel domain-containing protein [Escherichia coli]|uniref:autotransporter outer membrane beta-barrel domain-containing protein n=1 Tax=Escherichia coli TaxID=562 RepID=UPI00390495C9
MNKNIRILQFLVSILYSVQSHFSGAQTIQLNGNGIPESITRSITGVDGNAALNISVPYKTSYTQNILSVESSINIKGGTSNTSIGGAGVYGENFTLNNNGSVWGGDGYNGGVAVSGNKISINNYRNVYGGNGLGGSGSSGGAGLSGDDIIVDNYRSIYGGDDLGGTGGSGVTGSNITVHNSGGIWGGNGVNGGDGINGSNLFITNDNIISGGYGIKQGGDAISGNQITLNNNGIVQGGYGPDGGCSVYGEDIHINNHGNLSGLYNSQKDAYNTSIIFSGGYNSLDIYSDSVINGDIKLASIPVNGTNELIIKNINNATAINGGLMIGNGSSVYLSGKNSIFNGNISIDEDASMNLSVGNANVHANTITLKSDSWLNIDTSIKNWTQDYYTLLSSDTGISIADNSHIVQYNVLLTEGAESYVYTSLNDDDNKLISMLRWNNTKGMGYGTFNIEKDATLNIGVSLSDNLSPLLYDGWDGKSLTKSGNGTLILSATNNYTGNTEVKSGVLILAAPDALGRTEYLYLSRGAELDMNGYPQTISKLLTAAGSVLNIHGGSLILNNGGESAGTIAGDGSLNINGGMLDITGNNRNFSGVFTVNKGAQLAVSSADNLGTAFVDNYGTLTLNSTSAWQLTNNISGYGNVRKTGAGALNISDNAKWTGMTDIIQGTVILGNADSPVMLGSNQVIVEEQGKLSGFGGVAGNLSNSGIVDLTTYMPGNILTVGGNYTGRNGLILLQTETGGDNSKTDRLVIKGNASGRTRVAVTQAGGTGAETLNGIEVIHGSGNADNAEFIQTERITAGAYDYILKRGQGINSTNWYLISRKDIPVPQPEAVPESHDNNLRPEAGSYVASIAAANNLFVTNLYERQGQELYISHMTGEENEAGIWMYNKGKHNRWRDNSSQLRTRVNSYVVLIGGDIAQWSLNGTDRWHTGMMAGYGHNNNSTNALSTGYHSEGRMNGYTAGLYATWYANDETHNGSYLDSWLQYSWFDNHINGERLPAESWKSKGFTVSLEAGYSWKAGEFTDNYKGSHEWYVQPQLQVVRMNVKSDKYHESNGTSIENTGNGNILTRLGARTWLTSKNGKNTRYAVPFRPFVEAHWLHNSRVFGTSMNGVSIYQDGARDIGEINGGVVGMITPEVAFRADAGIQLGEHGYHNTSAMLSVEYRF